MTVEKYQERDQELKLRIADLRQDSADHNVQIMLNEKRITELEKERIELMDEFRRSNIEKEAA